MSTLTQLRTFVEVYRCQNITKAAENLGMSQPAVSAHIQTIESIIGQPLFIRQARGVQPNAFAHDLALQVSSHIDLLEQKMTSIRARSPGHLGTLNIAGPAEYLSLVFGEKLAHLLQEKQVNLVLHIGNKQEIYHSLSNNQVDIAITASTPDPQLFEYQVLDKEQLLLVMSAKLAQHLNKKKITSETLNQYPVVSYDQDLPLIRQYFEAVFNQPCRSDVAAVCSDIRIIEQIVSHGVGYSVLPDYLCKEALKKGELIQIGESGPQNTLYLVWRKGALKHPKVSFARDAILPFSHLNRH